MLIILIKVVIQTIDKYNNLNKHTFSQNKKYLLIQIQLLKYFNGLNLHFIEHTFPKSLKFTRKLYPSKLNILFQEIHLRDPKYKLQTTLNNKLILKRQLCTIVNQILNYYIHTDLMTFLNFLQLKNNIYSKDNCLYSGHSLHL